ncbi:MAG: ATP-binding protein [Patulibacter sp.]|nr:ATP-binding protein [Patulibacter sp.]
MRCPYNVCDGSGWIVDERTREAAECRCMPEQRAQRMAGQLRARIPREYRDASFEHSNISTMPRDAVRHVRAYVDALPERLAEGDGLWISGGVGAGKTWLAMLVARYAIEQGQAVAVYSVPRLLSEIRRTYDGEGLSTLELLDQLTSVSLLVLDDVGTERSNPWVLEQLYTIINERWQEQRSVVLTTNLDRDAMQEQIGERTVSRLEGMCQSILVDSAEPVDHRTERRRIDVGVSRHDPSGTGTSDGDGAVPAPGTFGAPPPFDPGPPADPYDVLPRPGARPATPGGETWGTDPNGRHRPVRRGSDR